MSPAERLRGYNSREIVDAHTKILLTLSTAVALLDDQNVYGKLMDNKTNSEAVLMTLRMALKKDHEGINERARFALQVLEELFHDTVRGQSKETG